MSKLREKVAIVTGAGQGVGQGIAFALAAEGVKVAVTGRTLSKCEITVDEIHRRGQQAIAISCDVKERAALEDCVEEAVKHFGGINILVNNAQQVPNGRLLEVSDESFEDGWQSGPLATLRLMKLSYPHLKGDGVIINLVSSAMKRWDMAGYGAYAAVKTGIQSLTRAAAAEWGVDNIRALAIAPHAESPGLKYWVERNPDEAEAFFKTIPLGRVGKLEEDIGRAVVALCSEDLAYLTGATIPLDGGQANFN